MRVRRGRERMDRATKEVPTGGRAGRSTLLIGFLEGLRRRAVRRDSLRGC